MGIPEFDITGQKVLVLGGGRGIGKGIALAFAEAGAEVAVSAVTSTGIERVASEIKKAGGTALAVQADATKLADLQRLTDVVLQKFGHIDTLVVSVGDSLIKPMVQLPDTENAATTDADWQFLWDINLLTLFQACRTIGTHLLARRSGSLITISGSPAFLGRGGMAPYGAAKAAVISLTQALAQEWAPYRVRVNGVAPGFFPDPEQVPAEKLAQMERDAAERTVPLGRIGRLKEVGYVAVFLASPAASYVTGQTWAIDGGGKRP